jgi:hypothetical protein
MIFVFMIVSLRDKGHFGVVARARHSRAIHSVGAAVGGPGHPQSKRFERIGKFVKLVVDQLVIIT